MRSKGNHLIGALEQILRIGREGNLPVKTRHMKAARQRNWQKMDEVIAMINELLTGGVLITADMYTHITGATGPGASMPTWVRAGGR